MGLGMVANHWDVVDNPAWVLCKAFFAIEAGVLILSVALLILFYIFKFAVTPEPAKHSKSETITFSNPVNNVGAPKVAILDAIPAPVPILQLPPPQAPTPPKFELSEQDLKDRAVQQIIRGW